MESKDLHSIASLNLIFRKIIAEPNDFKPSSPDMKVVGVFNPGVTTVREGGLEKTLLMIRVAEEPAEHPKGRILLPYMHVENRNDSKFKIEFDEEYRKDVKIRKTCIVLKDGISRLGHISHLRTALSTDGLDIDWKDGRPSFYPCYEHERFGVEDSRITPMKAGKYKGYCMMTYVSPHRDFGVVTSFAITKDFREFRRLPIGSPGAIFTSMKDVAPFPEKIPDSHAGSNPKSRFNYAALTRPNAFSDISRQGIWISYSPDMIYWGNHHRLIKSKKGEISGTGSPPVKVEDIWMAVYHEVEISEKSKTYRGALLGLDLEKPWQKVCMSPILMEPNEHDLEPGYIPNVVYPSGLVIRKDGTADIYAGEDDTYISVRRYYLEDLVKFVKSGI